MNKAVLTRFNFDPNTFVFAAISQGTDLDFSSMETFPPLPEVLDQPPGNY